MPNRDWKEISKTQVRWKEMKSYLFTFTVSREYEADELTKKDAKEMALQDFYDDARHDNLTPKVTCIVKGGK